MALPDAYRAISLLEFNVGAAASVALLNPLAAQIDALLSLGLGPFQLGVSAQFNAALALQASLSLNLGGIGLAAAVQASIAALAQLQAALALGLTLPSVSLNLSAAVALSATLKAQLGLIQLLIQAALEIKLPAVKAAARLSAALSVGPFFAISFSDTTVANVSSWLASEVSGGGLHADSHTLPANQPEVFGLLLFGPNPSFLASFNAIISVPS